MTETKQGTPPAKDPVDNGQTIEVRIHYEIPDDLPTVYAQHMTVQHEPDSFVVSFYESRPPLIVGDEEQRKQVIDNLRKDGITARCVFRFIMTPTGYKRTVEAMTENLEKWEAVYGSDDADE